MLSSRCGSVQILSLLGRRKPHNALSRDVLGLAIDISAYTSLAGPGTPLIRLYGSAEEEIESKSDLHAAYSSWVISPRSLRNLLLDLRPASVPLFSF